MNLNGFVSSTVAVLAVVMWRIAGALLLWLVGRILIAGTGRVLSRTLTIRRVDATLARYLLVAVNIGLNLLLIIAILGVCGVETTSFAAVLAAGGIAIGMAWSGLLANCAAGAFLVFLRPFRVGDFVSAAGVTGTVDAIGLFSTTINTPDNVRTIVGNNKVFSETIQNFSANPYRRVDLTVTINNAVDHRQAIRLLRDRVSRIPNVLHAPEPDVEILQFTAAGPLLCVRPYCQNQDYWQVYFDANRLIRETFGEAGFPVPMTAYTVNGLLAQPSERWAPVE